MVVGSKTWSSALFNVVVVKRGNVSTAPPPVIEGIRVSSFEVRISQGASEHAPAGAEDGTCHSRGSTRRCHRHDRHSGTLNLGTNFDPVGTARALEQRIPVRIAGPFRSIAWTASGTFRARRCPPARRRIVRRRVTDRSTNTESE
jgi:hypothetical protein